MKAFSINLQLYELHKLKQLIYKELRDFIYWFCKLYRYISIPIIPLREVAMQIACDRSIAERKKHKVEFHFEDDL